MTDNARPLRTLTLEEAAAFLQVHKSTVRELAKAGVIPGAKVGRAWRPHHVKVSRMGCKANEYADFAKTMYT